jgi:lambda repressor-like predicted transcriptional regulator
LEAERHDTTPDEPQQAISEQGTSLGEIASKTGIPKTSLHRYLAPAPKQEEPLPA